MEPEIHEPDVAPSDSEGLEIAEPEIAPSDETEQPPEKGNAPVADVELDDAEILPLSTSLVDLEPLSAPPPVKSSRPPTTPARVVSLRPSGSPRAAELGDTSKYREEIERQRGRG